MTQRNFPGWDEAWDREFEAFAASFRHNDLFPARVTGLARSLVGIDSQRGHESARLTGQLLRQAKEEGCPVTVGDWVVCRLPPVTATPASRDPVSVAGILPRRSVIERKRAISGGRKVVNDEVVGGRTQAQAVAANVDYAFVVTPLSEDSEPGAGLSRLERSMTLCAAGGVIPVAVYNKCDLVDSRDLPLVLEVARAVCPLVFGVSAKTGEGVEALHELLGTNKTAVFFGPSGAGKSSLVNALMTGDDGFVPLDTGPISQATGKGLHTTTSRDLICLSRGGMIIDTPGMRELALWVDDAALSEAFDDIVSLAGQCRFSDCGHQGEPGCAVREALDSGQLDPRRYENWRRMAGEVQRLDMRRIALWQKQQSRAKRYFDMDHR